MAALTFYQTSGPKSNTLQISTADKGTFTTLWRAKDVGKRIRIVNIANAIYNKGKSGITYKRGGNGVYAAMNGNSYNANLKKAKKLKGKTTDCSHYAAACARGAKCSYGYLQSSSLVKANLSKFTKFDAQKEFRNGTYQQGDIVCYNGHVAVVAYNGGNVKSNVFKNYKSDGSKKITPGKKVKKAKSRTKKYKKKHAHDTLKQLNAYLKQLQSDKKMLKNKIDKQKRKTQTKAVKDYIKKLKDILKKTKAAIKWVKGEIKNYKNNTGAQSKPGTTNNDDEYDDEFIDWNEGDDEEDDEDDTEEEKEPEIVVLEEVKYYLIRTGPNYFSADNDGLHKDYTGQTFCNRRIKIKTLETTASSWTFTFDMDFKSGRVIAGNISSISKVAGQDNAWRINLNTTNRQVQTQDGTYQYVFGLTTGSNIEYEFTCQITTHYND